MKFLNIRGATAVAILPPRYLATADSFSTLAFRV
jgi:hypothetical protein